MKITERFRICIRQILSLFDHQSTTDLKPKVATHSQQTFPLKRPFLHLLILSTVFHTFSKIKISNKKCTLKNESIYPFGKFKENPPIIKKLS
jgi:hypothetical protein